MTTGIARRRFTADEFEQMLDAGVLGGDRVELIDGEVVEMAAIGDKHWACVKRFTDIFAPWVRGRYFLSVQNSLRLSTSVVVEPDIVLFRRRDDSYSDAIPSASDVLLVIEVADSSLRYDRDVKRGLYAAAGVPDLWVASVSRPSILAFREPIDGTYTQSLVFRRGMSAAPLLLPDIQVAVNDALGL